MLHATLYGGEFGSRVFVLSNRFGKQVAQLRVLVDQRNLALLEGGQTVDEELDFPGLLTAKLGVHG